MDVWVSYLFCRHPATFEITSAAGIMIKIWRHPNSEIVCRTLLLSELSCWVEFAWLLAGSILTTETCECIREYGVIHSFYNWMKTDYLWSVWRILYRNLITLLCWRRTLILLFQLFVHAVETFSHTGFILPAFSSGETAHTVLRGQIWRKWRLWSILAKCETECEPFGPSVCGATPQ